MNGVLLTEQPADGGEHALYSADHAASGDHGDRPRGSPGVNAALSVLELLVARGPLSLSDIALGHAMVLSR